MHKPICGNSLPGIPNFEARLVASGGWLPPPASSMLSLASIRSPSSCPPVMTAMLIPTELSRNVVVSGLVAIPIRVPAPSSFPQFCCLLKLSSHYGHWWRTLVGWRCHSSPLWSPSWKCIFLLLRTVGLEWLKKLTSVFGKAVSHPCGSHILSGSNNGTLIFHFRSSGTSRIAHTLWETLFFLPVLPRR